MTLNPTDLPIKPHIEKTVVWRTLLPWRWQLLGLLGLVVVNLGLSLCLIPLAQQLDFVFQGGDWQLLHLAWLLGAIVACYWSKNALEYAMQLRSERLAAEWGLAQRAYFFGALLQSPWRALEAQSPEVSLSTLSADLDAVRQSLALILYRVLPSVILLSCLLAVLWYLSWPLTLVLFVIAPLFGWFFQRSAQVLSPRSHILQAQLASLYQELGDSLRHLLLIRLYRLESHHQERLAQAQQIWLKHYQALIRRQTLERPLMASVQIFVFAALLLFAAWLVQQDWLSASELLAFATALALGIDPGLWLSEAWAKLHIARASWERLVALHVQAGEQQSAWLWQAKASFEVRNLNYALPERPLLKALSFEMPAGARWGVCGASGAGKSTLLALLADLEPADSGCLLLPEAWRSASIPIVLVPQRAGFFNQTVRENLCLGKPVADVLLLKVLAICELEGWIQSLPLGLDTALGARDGWLSGGERQRLALARALLYRPALLLLDEATAELDERTEARVLKNMREFLPGMGWILVSHRPSSLHNLDKVWQLKEGKLVLEAPCQD